MEMVKVPTKFLITCEDIKSSEIILLRAVIIQHFILPYSVITVKYVFVRSVKFRPKSVFHFPRTLSLKSLIFQTFFHTEH